MGPPPLPSVPSDMTGVRPLRRGAFGDPPAEPRTSPAVSRREGPGRLRRSVGDVARSTVGGVVLWFLASRVVLAAALLEVFGPHRRLLGKAASVWDGALYLQVAKEGYPHRVTHEITNVVLLPVYPLVVRAVALVTGRHWVVTGVAVATVAGGSACVAVAALVAERFGPEAGTRAGVLLAFAPGAFFLSAPYADGLGIALSAACLLALARRRWVVAGAAAACAGATLPFVLTLIPATAFVAWRARDRRAWTAPALAPVGALAYCGYLWAHTGTPFAWFRAERAGWQSGLDLSAPYRWFATLGGISVVEGLCALAAAAGLWAMWRARVPGAWWVFTALILFTVTFDHSLWLKPRYLMDAFPVTVALGVVCRRRWFVLLAGSSACAMVVVALAYTSALKGVFLYQP